MIKVISNMTHQPKLIAVLSAQGDFCCTLHNSRGWSNAPRRKLLFFCNPENLICDTNGCVVWGTAWLAEAEDGGLAADEDAAQQRPPERTRELCILSKLCGIKYLSNDLTLCAR